MATTCCEESSDVFYTESSYNNGSPYTITSVLSDTCLADSTVSNSTVSTDSTTIGEASLDHGLNDSLLPSGMCFVASNEADHVEGSLDAAVGTVTFDDGVQGDENTPSGEQNGNIENGSGIRERTVVEGTTLTDGHSEESNLEQVYQKRMITCTLSMLHYVIMK